LPLLLLFTGARPEEMAQLIVPDIVQDEGGRWLIRITNVGAHPNKPARTLKTLPRTFPLPEPLIDLGFLRYVAALKRKGELAMFPRLRTKGGRELLFAGFGMWWSKYLKDHGINLEGEGRQPMREMRHTWSTAARRSKITREAMAYIQGHALPDATAGEGYGDLNPLGYQIDQLTFEGVDLSSVLPWSES